MTTIIKDWKLWKLTLLVLMLSYGVRDVLSNGNIGCLFAETLCIENAEWCHDDFAFGKCLPQYGLEPEDLLREPLTEEQSGLLATLLEDLQGAGLRWDHPFVQCRMQGALHSISHKKPMPKTLCANLAPDPEILGPQSPLAFVRFTPPDDDFAEEIYYPTKDKKAFDERFAYNNREVFGYPPPDNEPNIETDLPGNYVNPELNEIINRKQVAAFRSKLLANQIANIKHELVDILGGHGDKNKNVNQMPQPQMDILNNRVFYYPNKKQNDDTDLSKRTDAPHTSFRQISKEQHIPQESIYYGPSEVFDGQRLDEVNDETEVSNNKEKYANDLNLIKNDEPGVYTEGGLVYVPDGSNDDSTEVHDLLRNIMGFQRHERLDVKKPGPPLSVPLPPLPTPMKTISAPAQTKEVIPDHSQNVEMKKSKKFLIDHSDEEDHAPHSVDTEYAHVILKHPIESWTSGARIVTAIGEMLNIKLSHPRVDRHEVSFRVEPNPDNKNAVDVAKFINDTRFKNNLSRRLGISVLRAGVGDKTKESMNGVQLQRVTEAKGSPDMNHVIVYMFAGAGAAAVVVIVVTLLLVKKYGRKRDKLGCIQTEVLGNERCSKDYQELCRARMAVKGSTDNTSGRIASLSKESDARPPSSRSSTSSWSEEPALSNMDISTGHMVLSYMEDHLRNKGRLQREWVALCRYEAEPSARDAALQPQCATLNRTGAPLPYDHSRVVLNHLTNAEALDYINASTITDHDPRAPAYVAAQGPLPSTLAHFWQMIWEQGSVVIVSLCRIQENGESVCARYWPEEGSEVYHIYEVHLVSEHIWCEDYLVRSFYLKNLRTSETRTVTQFHFLSWPQDGIPASVKALLEFRRKVNKSYRGRSCPIVVHSSHGSGRTGAYILLDLVLARMNKGAREIDIAATLEHLRDQRAGLVATRQQFEFVLMAVAEEVHAILKSLPTNAQTEKRDLEKDTIKEKTEDENSTKANEK